MKLVLLTQLYSYLHHGSRWRNRPHQGRTGEIEKEGHSCKHFDIYFTQSLVGSPMTLNFQLLIGHTPVSPFLSLREHRLTRNWSMMRNGIIVDSHRNPSRYACTATMIFFCAFTFQQMWISHFLFYDNPYLGCSCLSACSAFRFVLFIMGCIECTPKCGSMCHVRFSCRDFVFRTCH